MIYIYFILLTILGLIATFFGGKWSFKTLMAKSIASFKISETESEIEINKPGKYSICILGAGLIENLNDSSFTLINKNNNKKIPLKELLIKPRFSKNMKLGIELIEFSILDPGNFILTIKDYDKLKAKSSQLFLKNLTSPNIDINTTTIIVRETQSLIKKIGAIILLVLGVNASAWGFILIFFSDNFK